MEHLLMIFTSGFAYSCWVPSSGKKKLHYFFILYNYQIFKGGATPLQGGAKMPPLSPPKWNPVHLATVLVLDFHHPSARAALTWLSGWPRAHCRCLSCCRWSQSHRWRWCWVHSAGPEHIMHTKWWRLDQIATHTHTHTPMKPHLNRSDNSRVTI